MCRRSCGSSEAMFAARSPTSLSFRSTRGSRPRPTTVQGKSRALNVAELKFIVVRRRPGSRLRGARHTRASGPAAGSTPRKAGATQQSRPRFGYTSPPRAAVAQLDRVPGFEPGGRGFESLRPRQQTKKSPLWWPFLFARAAGGIETTEPLHVSGRGFDKNRRERFLDVREQSKACSRTAQRVAAMDGVATYPSGRAPPRSD